MHNADLLNVDSTKSVQRLFSTVHVQYTPYSTDILRVGELKYLLPISEDVSFCRRCEESSYSSSVGVRVTDFSKYLKSSWSYIFSFCFRGVRGRGDVLPPPPLQAVSKGPCVGLCRHCPCLTLGIHGPHCST